MTYTETRLVRLRGSHISRGLLGTGPSSGSSLGLRAGPSLAWVFWSLALSASSALATLKASLSLVASSRFVLRSLGYFKNLLIAHRVLIVKEKGNRGCLVPFLFVGPSLLFSLPVAVVLYVVFSLYLFLGRSLWGYLNSPKSFPCCWGRVVSKGLGRTGEVAGVGTVVRQAWAPERSPEVEGTGVEKRLWSRAVERRGECETPEDSGCMARAVRPACRTRLAALLIHTVQGQRLGRSGLRAADRARAVTWGECQRQVRSKGRPQEDSGPGASVGGK